MATLKDNLDKILKAKGSKHFYFGYGTGKRKDNNGEGALLVSETKTLKKEDLTDDCACAQFHGGKCWGSSDGGTIFFEKLGSTTIGKMMLTARKLTNKQYEFAAPTKDEEERAEKAGASGNGQSKDGTTEPEKTAPVKTEAETVAPQGKVAFEVLRIELHKIRVEATKGIVKLVDELRKTEQQFTAEKNAEAAKVAVRIGKVVTQLAQGMPGELEHILQELDKSLQANDATAVTKHKAELTKGAVHWQKFLTDNKKHIHGAETNPYRIPIKIAEPMRESLSAIIKTAAH